MVPKFKTMQLLAIPSELQECTMEEKIGGVTRLKFYPTSDVHHIYEKRF